MTHDLKMQLSRTGAVIAAACAALLAGQASAQSLGTNSAELNGGWRRLQGTENGGVNVRTRDENGNRLIVDGIIQDGSTSEDVDSDASGAGSVYAGAGGRRRGGGTGSATAIGNNLQVITTGNWNTVIVNSTQINNGNVTANSRPVLNGELKLND